MKLVFVRSISEVHVCMCVHVQSYVYTNIHNLQHPANTLWPKEAHLTISNVSTGGLKNSRYSTRPSSLCMNKVRKLQRGRTFHKRSTCMYVCTCAISQGNYSCACASKIIIVATASGFRTVTKTIYTIQKYP